jgi:Flp pilus assembly protein TadG
MNWHPLSPGLWQSRPASRLRDLWRRMHGDRRGMAALELVFISPLLVTAALAVVELGNAAQQQIVVQQALWAGGEYALRYPDDNTGITNTVTNALPSNWTNITVGAVANSCSCWSSASTSSCATSGAPCATGKIVERFMTLAASSSYRGNFLNTTIASNYVVRYQ